jgi:hypothetical protein
MYIGCPHRLHGQPREPRFSTGAVETYFGVDSEGVSSLYRHDYRLFSYAVLATVLEGADFRKPTGVFCTHGFLTINGQ